MSETTELTVEVSTAESTLLYGFMLAFYGYIALFGVIGLQIGAVINLTLFVILPAAQNILRQRRLDTESA